MKNTWQIQPALKKGASEASFEAETAAQDEIQIIQETIRGEKNLSKRRMRIIFKLELRN